MSVLNLLLLYEMSNMLHSFYYESKHWHGVNTNQHSIISKGIPFEFKIKLPPPLRNGIDYGFKSSKLVSGAFK